MKKKSKSRFRVNVNNIPIATVVLAEGTDLEAEFDVRKPVGFRGTDLAFKLLENLNSFQQLNDEITEDTPPTEANMKLMGGLKAICGTEEYWTKLLPEVLGVNDDPEAIEFINSNYAMMDTFGPFVEAAERIVSVAMGGSDTQREAEVEAALKKSEGDEATKDE